MIEVAPSVLAADVLNMGRDVQLVLDAGADVLHVDVMDAHFVPNLSYGPHVVRALRDGFGSAYLDVHLMMTHPGDYIASFADAGADAITIHAEISGDLHAVLRDIRRRGLVAGLSLKPNTPVDALAPYLDEAGLVLIMSVEPGFGGQKMLPETLKKLAALRAGGFKGTLSVDGGITALNADQAVTMGASRLVMGTALFKAEDPAGVIRYCQRLVP